MTDILRKGAEWLEQQRKSFCSSPVLYEHNGQSATVNATWGKTDYEIVGESGMTVGSHVIDFLITAADLDFEPEPGDEIEADGVRYEVMPLGDDVRGWRWSDPFRKTYRIHTRQTA